MLPHLIPTIDCANTIFKDIMSLNVCFAAGNFRRSDCSGDIACHWCNNFPWIFKINTLGFERLPNLSEAIMPGLLIGVRHGTPLFYEKPTVAFNSLRFQAPMQCKLWDNRVQAIAELCLFNSIPLTSSHCLFPPFPAVCVVVLWSCWPSPCVFTFGSDLSSATSGEPNTNWTVTVHRPLFGRGCSAGSPLAATRLLCRPLIPDPRSLGTWLPIKLPPNAPTGHKRQTTSEKGFRWPQNIQKKRVQAQRKHWKGTDRQCLGGVLFIFSVKVKFSLVS